MSGHSERGVIPRARLNKPSVRDQLLEGFCSRDELAEALGVQWRSIYTYLKQGLPSSVRVGATRYYNIGKVRDWLESQDPRRSPRPIGRPLGSLTSPDIGVTPNAGSALGVEGAANASKSTRP